MGGVGRWIVHIYIASCGEGLNRKNQVGGTRKQVWDSQASKVMLTMALSEWGVKFSTSDRWNVRNAQFI
jgi:hypothetical protein